MLICTLLWSLNRNSFKFRPLVFNGFFDLGVHQSQIGSTAFSVMTICDLALAGGFWLCPWLDWLFKIIVWFSYRLSFIKPEKTKKICVHNFSIGTYDWHQCCQRECKSPIKKIEISPSWLSLERKKHHLGWKVVLLFTNLHFTARKSEQNFSLRKTNSILDLTYLYCLKKSPGSDVKINNERFARNVLWKENSLLLVENETFPQS